MTDFNDTAKISGYLYIFFGLAPLPLSLRIVWVILKNAEFRKEHCYILMAHVGVIDCIQLMFIVPFGVTISTGYLRDFTVHVTIPVIATTWLLSLVINLLLAGNRLNILCELHLPRHSLILALFLCYIYGLFFLISYATPLSQMEFDGLIFFYNMTQPYSRFVKQAEYYSAFTVSAVTLIIYVVLVVYVIRRKTSMSSTNSFVFKAELRIFLQSLVIFASATFLELSWNFPMLFLPNSLWSVTVVNLLMSIHAGLLCPGLCLLFNTPIRRAVLRMEKNTVVSLSRSNVQ
ncbi:hypothetical protein QR680_010792 [Steinernema hermaphroditum]|uniref:7TM GPCR serpentine receptor class x (Srx) domain-containing protein n=1 Tax=Steinernema hermaphroditum TaxID=289476 RepID=A0AA39MC50_9BILA|nr:hypothetical protein QR680_010792 [Steinernema hermaphroditum]